MKMTKFFFFFITWAGLGWSVIYAQTSGYSRILALQDSLVGLGRTMYNNPSEPERLQANFTFVKTLVSALRTPHSYDFPFDSLNMVSLLRSPDDRFRIFTWHLPLNDGSYLYYGTIQLNTPDGNLRMIPLLDKTYEIDTPETAVTSAADWYGAQYYRIIPLGGDYVLLGWKGHTPEVTQKVMEVLRFSGGGVQLGGTVFSGGEGDRHTRIIYRFNRQASMYLDYHPAQQRILLDHLAPADPRDPDNYAQYGPDMTYDAWELANGRLVLSPDVEFINAPDGNDAFYNDPMKPSTHPKSGFPEK